MTFDPRKHHRRSIRLPGYDYSTPASYFVTIVCKDRVQVLDAPAIKAAVNAAWLSLPERYDHVELDDYVIMPNHLHGIIDLIDADLGDSRADSPPTLKRKPLGQIMAAFKTISTRQVNDLRGTPGVTLWQRNYYEHIIRDGRELDEIRNYIISNPLEWNDDPDNPHV